MSRDESIVNTFVFGILWKESVLCMHSFEFCLIGNSLTKEGPINVYLGPGSRDDGRLWCVVGCEQPSEFVSSSKLLQFHAMNGPQKIDPAPKFN